MEFRTLDPSEREALLELLDGWEMADGWRGRDFFRRYLEHDPTFRDHNVWVAAGGGRLLSCVQIFPREVAVAGRGVPLGGIGSVFTAADARRRGLGERLLALATDAMRRRGMELSLLFAARIPWYTKLGWSSWPSRRALLEGPGRAGATRVDDFDAPRDGAAVRALHVEATRRLEGLALRDDALWEASLRNAGNPGEDFLVARDARGAVAYARATVLYGQRVVTEVGAREGAAEALADVLVRAAGEHAVAPDADVVPGLASALASRGVRLREVRDPTVMLRCLDPAALARRLGVPPPAPDEPPEAFLGRTLPPERFRFWMADRF